MTRGSVAAALPLLFVVALAALPLAAQQPFTAGTNLVVVPVSSSTAKARQCKASPVKVEKKGLTVRARRARR